MKFIDVQCLLLPVRALFHPCAVPELILTEITDHRGIPRTQLHAVPVRVAVVDKLALFIIDTVLIHHPRLRIGRRDFPEIAVMDFLHGDLLPPAELPDQRDTGCRWGKCAEHSAAARHMRAKILVRVKTLSCIKTVKIHNLTSN